MTEKRNLRDDVAESIDRIGEQALAIIAVRAEIARLRRDLEHLRDALQEIQPGWAKLHT